MRTNSITSKTRSPLIAVSAADLPNHFLRFSASDLAGVRKHFKSLNKSIDMSTEQPSRFVEYREVLLPLDDMTLTFGCINSGAGYDLAFRSCDEYIVTIPLRGNGWASTGHIVVEYSSDDVMIVASSCSVIKHWTGPGEVLSLHIPSVRLEAYAGFTPLNNLLCAPIVKVDASRLVSFLNILDMVCRDLGDRRSDSIFLRQPFAAEIANILVRTLLDELHQMNPADQMLGEQLCIVPYYVKRAREFIAANSHLPIGIDEITAAAGVSARTIQYGFRDHLKTTPMVWLKRHRLGRARAILLAPQRSHRSILELAADVGLYNASQFSRDYRALFRETPSETSARPRRLVS